MVLVFAAACAGGGSDEAARPGVRASWGAGPADLGKSAPAESAPEAPKSFCVAADGTLHVLDQVNRRIQTFSPEGAWVRGVPLPERPFEDLELWGGGFALLDLHASPALVFVDSAGAVQREFALAGPELPEPARVTALHARSDGYWVEVEDEYRVRLADRDGMGVDREVSTGLRADVWGGVVTVRGGPGEVRLEGFALPAREVSLLAELGDGRVAVAVIGEGAQPDPETPPAESHELVVLGPTGQELARHTLPPPGGPEDVFRRVRLGADGRVHALVLGAEGAEIVRVTP